MNPDDELLLDTFARAPEALSEERRRKAERLVGADEGAGAFVQHLRAFYALLEEEGEETPRQVERFVGALFDAEERGTSETRSRGPAEDRKPAGSREPATTEARPFKSHRGPKPTVLAAATNTLEGDEDRRFRTYATLVADGGDTLVRIVGDQEARRGRLYVLSGTPGRQAWTVVSLPELGLDVATGSDGAGTFDLPEEAGPADWENVTALVRRPIAEAEVHPGAEVALSGTETALSGREAAPSDREEADPVLRCRHEGDRLAVAADDSSRAVLLTAQLSDDKPNGAGSSVFRLDAGGQAYPVPNKTLTVRAYR